MYRVTLHACEVCYPRFEEDDRGILSEIKPHGITTFWEDETPEGRCTNCGGRCRVEVKEEED